MSSALESPLSLMSAVPAAGAVPMAASALPGLQAAIAAGYVPSRQLTGKVLGIWGKALIRLADGTITELKVGDVVKKGDVVLTSQDGIVQIEADRSPATAEIDRVIEQVAQGDPLTAPAAGVTGGDGSLQPGLRVDRVAEAVGGAGFDGGALAGAAAGLLAQALPPEDGLPATTDAGPNAQPDSVTTAEDTAITFDPRGNDGTGTLTIVSVAGQPIAVGSPVQLPQGLITLNADGTLTFTPNANFNGTLTFTYGVSDGTNPPVTALITIEVTPVNDAPVGGTIEDEDGNPIADPNVDPDTGNYLVSTPEDTPVSGVVRATDVDGDTLTFGAGTPPTHGTVVINPDGSWTYTPDPNYNGPDSFTVVISDGNGGVTTATVQIGVTPVNDAPVIGTVDDDDGNPIPDPNLDPETGNYTATTPEDTPVSGVVRATDEDGDPLTFSKGSDPAHGTVTVNPDGTWTYTPDPDYNGPDSFTVTVTDPSGATSTATVVIGVTPLSDSPAVAADSATTPEDTPVVIDVLANDSDADNTSLTITAINGQPIAVGSPVTLLDENKAPLGTVALNPDGTLTFTPAEGVNGPVEFTYTATDGQTEVSAGVTVDVTPVNDPPRAAADRATTEEDTPVTIDVRANDIDPDGEPLTVTAVTQPANGTVSIDPVTGNPVYTPNEGFNGSDTFTYTVRDPSGATSTATVTVTVGSVNDAPVAADDTGTTSEDAALAVNAADGVLNGPGADSDPDGDTLAVTQVAFGPNTAGPGQAIAGAFGFLTLNVDGSYTYRPNDAAQALDDGESGVDVFTYTVTDPAGATTTATLTLTVTGVNDGPVAVDDRGITPEDTPVTLAVLDNDTDADGDPLTITAIEGTPVSPGDSVAVTGPNGEPAGTVTLNPDGTLTFVPEPGYNGPVDFDYTVSDGTDEDTGRVNLVVDSVNDAPDADPDSVRGPEDRALTFDPRGNDVDPDGDPLTITQINGQPISVGSPVTLPEGVLELNDDGTLTFTPNPDFNGDLSFDYTVSDGRGGTATSTVNVTIDPVNDAPVAEDDTVSTPEGVPVSGAIDATDPDGDPLTFTAGDPPTNGTLELNPDGTWTYTPNPGYNGPDSFTVIVTDPDGETTTATITIGVTPVSESPSVADDSATTPESTAVTLDVLANDADPDGDPLTITEVDGQPIAVGSPVTLLDENKSPLGTVALNPDGTLTFTPADGVNGPVEFSYTVTDGTTPVTGKVTVDVTPVNDPPAAGDDSVTTSENTAVVIDVRANDTDPDGDALTVTAVTQPANGTVTIDPATGNPVYTPAAGFNGTDTFTYTVTDAEGLTSTATVTVTVGGVNDAPVAVDDTGTTSEDVALVVDAANGVLNGPGADSDPDGDTLSVTQVAFGANTAGPGQVIAGAFGFLTLNADGSYTYRPNDAAQALDDGESGVDVFTYTVKDPSGASTTATLTLTVTGVNDGPVAIDDNATTGPDTPVTLAVLDNDSDPDSDPLTITAIAGTPVSPGDSVAVTGPSGEPAGTVTLNPDGTLTFVPEPGYSGPVDFDYTVSDGTTEDVGAVKIVVDGNTTNDPPVADDDSLVTDEDTPVSFDPRADDTDIDGGPLTITQINGRPIAVGTPVTLDEGTVSLNDDGTLTFTPNPDFNGPVSFEYTVDDGNGGTDTATVDITVNPVNDAPVAVDDVQSVPEDTVATGNVLGNDTDAEDDPLVVTGFSVDTDNDGTPETFRPGETAVIAGVGEITLDAEGNYTFTPETDFNGPVPDITYTVSDGQGGTDEGTLKLDVGSRPDALITLDPNITPDDILNAAEAGGDVIVTGRVGADVKLGDTVTLTVNGQAFTGLVLVGGTFAIAVSGAALAADPDRTIEASVTTVDSEGNSVTATDTETYGVDTTPPVASITLDANITPDDIVNAAEAGGTVAITGRVGGDVQVGDTVTLTINGETFTGLVRADRSFSIDVAGAALAADPDRSIDASVTTTDAAGNSATATDTEGYGVDTTPPAASITLDANITPDDIISAAEAGQTIPVTGTVGGDVKVGDTVTLTINGETFTGLVRADRSFSIDVPGSALAADPDRTIDASVTTTDAAGNSTTATDTEGYRVDGAPTLDLDGSSPGTGYSTRFNENGAGVALADLDLAIADPDSATLQGATVTLTNPQPGDVLVVGALPPGISATISGSTVTLSGAASADAYEAALRAISFDNPNSDPSTTPRVVEITVNDGLQDSNTAVATVSTNTVEPVDDPSGEPYSFALGNYASNDLWTDLDSKGLAVQFNAIKADGSTGSLFVFDTTLPITDNSLGVDGTTRTNPTGVPGQIEHDRITGLSESILVNFNGLANTATFDVASMNPTEDGGEVGRWVAYYQGTVVATGEFRTTPPFSSQSFTIDTGTAVFDSIRFEARPTVGNNQILDGSDYYLAGLKVSGPASVNGPYTLAENETLTITTGSPDTLLANDSDADGDRFSITGINGNAITSGQTVVLPSGALLTINADGSFAYNPNGAYDSLDAGQVATDTFTYTVTDAFGATDTATATVTIIGVDATNNGPVAENDAFTVAEDTALTLVPNQLTGNDDDPDADPLTILSVQNAVNGTVALVNGNVVFTPAPDYNGPASFTYTVSDGKGGTATARVDLTVEPRPDATITLSANVTDDDILSAAEANQTVPVTGTVGGDAKPGDTVTLTVNGKTFTTTVASDLTFSVPVPGTDLAADPDRTVQASITTVDANGNAITATDTDTYTVNTGVPSARNGSATTSEDQPYVFRWSDFGVTDRDGGPAEAVVISRLPADGTLQVFIGGVWVNVTEGSSVSRATIDSAGLRFVPDANESGDASFGGTGAGNQRPDYARFDFAPTDGVNTGTTRSFTIDVAPVADTPVTSVTGSTTTLKPFELPASQGLSWDYYDELDKAGPDNASNTQNVEDAIERDGTPTQSKLIENAFLSGTYLNGKTEPGGENDTRYTDEDDASRFSGFIFLEAGKTYTFSGTRDDTMRIELGGTTVYDEGFNQFGTFTAGTYRPTVSGFYSLEVIYYNGDGPGGLDLNMAVNGGAAQSLSTSNFLLLKNTQSIDQAGIPLSSFNPIGGDGGGYYPLPGPDASDTLVPLEVSASLTDTDGSETLSLLLSGLPAGFTVTDGVRTAVVGTSPLHLTGWDLDSLAVRATEDYTGTSLVTLTATATEPNGSTASSSQSFNLVYTSTEARVVPVAGTAPLDGGDGRDDCRSAEDPVFHWNFDDRGVWCPSDESRDAHHDRDGFDRQASRGESLSLRDVLHDQGTTHGLDACTTTAAGSSRTAAAGAGKEGAVAYDSGVHTTLALAGLSVDTQIASDLLRQQQKVDAG